MNQLEQLEDDVGAIKDRNLRVEAEKAWEVSVFRISCISLLTYFVAGLVFSVIENEHPWRNALIPAVGYFLSTQSLPFVKKKWIDRYQKRRNNS